jgi:hypothetical protein
MTRQKPLRGWVLDETVGMSIINPGPCIKIPVPPEHEEALETFADEWNQRLEDEAGDADTEDDDEQV